MGRTAQAPSSAEQAGGGAEVRSPFFRGPSWNLPRLFTHGKWTQSEVWLGSGPHVQHPIGHQRLGHRHPVARWCWSGVTADLAWREQEPEQLQAL